MSLTRGPWQIRTRLESGGRVWRQIVDDAGRAVVREDGFIHYGEGEETRYGVYMSEDDARLIAAAPNLLHACYEALDATELNAPRPVREDAARLLREAIHQATNA